MITLRAVEKYVSSIFSKLGLPSTGTESRRAGRPALSALVTEDTRKPPPDSQVSRLLAQLPSCEVGSGETQIIQNEPEPAASNRAGGSSP